jgi:hypothetical protein
MNHVGRTEDLLLCTSVCSELEREKGTWLILTDVLRSDSAGITQLWWIFNKQLSILKT